jgi:hypothetical protein
LCVLFIASGIGISFVGMRIAIFIIRIYSVSIYITLTICIVYIHLAGANICLGTMESCFECDALRQLCLLPQTRRHPSADVQLSLRLVPDVSLTSMPEKSAVRLVKVSVVWPTSALFAALKRS